MPILGYYHEKFMVTAWLDGEDHQGDKVL